MRTLILGVLASASLGGGCAVDGFGPSDPSDPPGAPSDPAPLPTATGSYAGSYQAPTSDALAPAATFTVDEVEWVVIGGAVTLHYNLPAGLVGGHIGVTLTGTMTAGDATIELAGSVGVGACVATTTRVICREEFGDLGPLPISMAVVRQIAARDYPGPVADRVAVAGVFSSDPIGIVEIDLLSPVVDDHGGGSDDP